MTSGRRRKADVKSLGAAFVELDLETQEGEGGYAREQSEDFLRRQRELIGKEVAAADVVITTAAIPGRKAPVLVTEEMMHQMALGSVIVDLAAETGGNCELSRPGENARGGRRHAHRREEPGRARCPCTRASSTRATSPSSCPRS